MNIPYSTDFSKAKAVVLGVPYDGGLHPTRIGSRTGPAAIREQSQLVRPFQPPFAKFNPLELLNVVDCGIWNVATFLILRDQSIRNRCDPVHLTHNRFFY